MVIAAGIFLSRIAGFVRSRALAHYLGNSDAADAFTYALKFPNLLQNLFGEGVLSASFIPVYARLLEEKRTDEARRLAGAVAAMLGVAVSVLVLAGVLGAPLLVDTFVPGYGGEKRQACIHLVRIMFPGSGILVMSAWCLGVLNSHRRFFLSYVAPVLWNAAIIGALLYEGRYTRLGYPLAAAASWGAVVGSVLQLLMQLPAVLLLLRGLRRESAARVGAAGQPRPSVAAAVMQVRRSFLPVVLGRGVVQISSWLDTFIASFLVTGAMAGLGYAQMLYLLPISLFGMAVSASELPEMARATGDAAAIAGQLQARLTAGLRRMAFFVVPSMVAYLALGDSVVGLVYRTGRFGAGDTRLVWAILGGFSIGLLAATQARLYSSTFYALRDTGTPFRIAIVRVLAGTSLAALLAFGAVRWLKVEPKWGVVGLALASGVAAWVEMLLLRRALTRRLGVPVTLEAKTTALLLVAAAMAAAAGHGVKVALWTWWPALPALVGSAVVLGCFGVVYLAAALMLGNAQARGLLGRLTRR